GGLLRVIRVAGGDERVDARVERLGGPRGRGKRAVGSGEGGQESANQHFGRSSVGAETRRQDRAAGRMQCGGRLNLRPGTAASQARTVGETLQRRKRLLAEAACGVAGSQRPVAVDESESGR